MLSTRGGGKRSEGGGCAAAFLSVLIIASVGLAGPSALAVGTPAPERSSQEVSGLHFLSDVCGTPILQDGMVYVTARMLADGRVTQQVRVDIVLSVSSRVAFERPAFTAVIDPQAQTVTLEGTLVNISAPGVGILLKDVGPIVRDLSTSDILTLVGRWMALQGAFDEVCRYFTTPM